MGPRGAAGEFFFTDHSDKLIQDPVLQQLLQFNNVILTARATAGS